MAVPPVVPMNDFATLLYRWAKATEFEAGRRAGLERNRLLSLASAIRAEARIQAQHNNSVEGTK